MVPLLSEAPAAFASKAKQRTLASFNMVLIVTLQVLVVPSDIVICPLMMSLPLTFLYVMFQVPLKLHGMVSPPEKEDFGFTNQARLGCSLLSTTDYRVTQG